MPLSPEQILNNRYRIETLLGQGGFGAVYRAWDLNLERPRAIKENLDASLEAQAQFKREAQILSDLSHPNLPRVVDHFFIPNQGQYLVMDYVEGEDLQKMLQHEGGALEEAQVLPWIFQVIDALAYLHRQSPPVVHRDIKPANIKITPEGVATLVDFGIAKVYFPSARTEKGAKAVASGYSPPEQYGGEFTDVRSDIYALGATLFHLLTGKRPPDSTKLAGGSATLALPSQLNSSISPKVENAILTCMEIDANNRYQSIVDLKTALAESLSSISVRKPLPGRWIFVAGGIALIVLIGLYLIGVIPGFRGDITTEEPLLTGTTLIQIVYRSPEEMNLQPEDVPDLQEVPVENPAQEPLLPEAIDQDQRAYLNVAQDINIESNVIMVPEQTSRTDDELYDLIVVPRRPGIQRPGKDEHCELGDRCRFIPIIDKKCGPGWSAIIVRDNLITILIGCGHGVDDDLIRRIAKPIDDHIKATPKPEEIAPTLTPPMYPGPTSTEDPCVSLGLTPEECVNVGTHSYSYQHSLSEPCFFPLEGGGKAQEKSGNDEITFKFYIDSVEKITGLLLGTYIRTGQNTYKTTYEDENGSWTTYLTFNIKGFLIDGTWNSKHGDIYNCYDKGTWLLLK